MVMFSKIIMVGCGAVGASFLGLLHHAKDPILQRMIVVSKFEKDLVLAKEMGIETHLLEITSFNFEKNLLSLAIGKVMILNLANEVSTYDLMRLCKKMEWNYLDAAVNTWFPLEESSSYLDHIVKLEDFKGGQKIPTMICGFGANPGLVSSFTKQALSDIADVYNFSKPRLHSGANWADFAQQLGVVSVQISEFDSQKSKVLKNGYIRNTWSVSSFMEEMFANVCFAAGSQNYMGNDTHDSVLGPYVYLQNKLAYEVGVETWVPSVGIIDGYLVPHEETFTISDYLTLKDNFGRILYKPTCYFAYKPCDEAMHSVNKFHSYSEVESYLGASSVSCMGEDITKGTDEVGVLVSLNNGKSYWYGAGLSIDFTRRICKESNGTVFYVAAGLYGALEYIKNNPHEGYLSNEEIDHSFVLKYAEPYLENLKGYMIDWSPRSVDQYIRQ